MRTPNSRVRQNIIELMDLLASMMLLAPKFLDDTGYLPHQNLDSMFRELYAGLDFNRTKLGEARYLELKRMTDEMRPLFEADPDNKTGQTVVGRKIILAMEDILRQVKRKA
jgi:hypothetical protein